MVAERTARRVRRVQSEVGDILGIYCSLFSGSGFFAGFKENERVEVTRGGGEGTRRSSGGRRRRCT